MPVLDVFTPDAFAFNTLTAAMNNLSFTPTALGQRGLFEEAGVPNLAALIEEIGDTVALVAVKPRNSSGQVAELNKAKLHSLTIPHLPQRASVMADSVQGIREFGSESNVKTIEGERDKKLAKMRRQIDYTIEYHRLLALQGSYMDVNGATQSAFTLFGTSQTSIDFALNNAATKVRAKCLEVQTSVETALGGVPYEGIDVDCGATFWSDLITHAMVEATYLNSQMAAALREGLLNTLDFGDLRFRRYRGNSTVAISAKHAYASPRGVSGMFLTRFAPAPYAETVNTIGLPYYAKAKMMDFDVGVDMQSQSNPLNICTRPSAVIKLTTP